MPTESVESSEFPPDDDILQRIRSLCWCGIYTRQSRDTNSEYRSCEAQLDACLAVVRSRFSDGWVCNGYTYEDEAESSETLERPGLQLLLEHIREGKVGRVVIHRLDRLSRSLVDCIGFLQELQDRQVPLTIVTQREVGTTADHSFLLNLMAAFAEFEQEMTRERLADARVALKTQGRRVAGVVPYGYDADPVTKQLIIEPREARRVRKMFQWAGEGKTPRQIAETANRRGWRTKARITKKTGEIRGGALWTSRQILAMLSNPIYAGKIRDGDATRPGSHKAIVDLNIFDQAQEAVASRRTRQPGRESPRISWPLRGLLFCGQCDRVMSPSISGYRSLQYRYYRCRSQAGGRPPCPGVSVPAHEIEQYVLNLLSNADVWQTDTRLTAEEKRRAGAFAAAWTVLDDTAARNLLPHVIDRVAFHARRATISVTIDDQAIDRLRSGNGVRNT